jgi:hypothetical protein
MSRLACDPAVKVAGPPRRTAWEGARGCTHAAGDSNREVPTVVDGMRCAARLAAGVRRVVDVVAIEGEVIACHW